MAVMIRRICHEISTRPHRLPSSTDNKSPSDDKAAEDGKEDDGNLNDDTRVRSADKDTPVTEETAAEGDHAGADQGAQAILSFGRDLSSLRRPSSFDQRDVDRSAFVRVPSTEEKDDREGMQQAASTDPNPTDENRTSPVAVKQEDVDDQPLPYESPMRYYHREEEERLTNERAAYAAAVKSESRIEGDEDTPHSYQYNQYPGMPYGYSRPEPYHQQHPAEYEDYPRHGYDGYDHSSYHYQPSADGRSSDYYSHGYYDQRQHPQTPHSTSATAAVTHSARGKGGGGEGLDPSHSGSFPDGARSYEDDRKPSAARRAGRIGILRRDAHPGATRRGSDNIDIEPIPLNDVVRSSNPPGSPPSNPNYFGEEMGFDDAFPRHHHWGGETARAVPPQRQFLGEPARPMKVEPPRPKSSSRSSKRKKRKRERVIAPSSSGSTASSTGSTPRSKATAAAGESWDTRFRELQEFRRTYGHCDVPQNYPPNTRLGTWVNKQRMEHKNRVDGKNSSLTDSRLERLESVDFTWAKRKGIHSWNEKFRELCEYQQEHGNCHVPTKYKQNTALGRWVSTQRSDYKKFQEGKKSTMTEDKIARLESIGFAWYMAI
mmetsp:Transcript_32576/g.77779  ORF Transcript_32576/g.77779 Transcript_32576/m.77779 type:complete len:601 (-) Transcript_32576:231-2033(-)